MRCLRILRIILRLNAASCLLFGGLLLLAPNATAAFLGTASAGLMTGIGVLLLLNGLHLAVASYRKRMITMEVYYFSAGDLAWVAFTLVLVASGVVITTPAGIVASLVVATAVGGLGLAQIRAVMGAALPSTSDAPEPVDQPPR